MEGASDHDNALRIKLLYENLLLDVSEKGYSDIHLTVTRSFMISSVCSALFSGRKNVLSFSRIISFPLSLDTAELRFQRKEDFRPLSCSSIPDSAGGPEYTR